MSTPINRREFLEGSALAAGSLLIGGVPAAAQTPRPVPKTYNETADGQTVINTAVHAADTDDIRALIIWGARRATRQMQRVPDGRQNFWEWIVESLQGFLEGVLGRELASKTFSQLPPVKRSSQSGYRSASR